MIVRDTWKPRPRRNFHYKDIHSGYKEHCMYGAYLDYMKEIGGIYDYKFIFYDEQFLIRYREKDYYLIPQYLVLYTQNVFEYQTYTYGLTQWYQKMWKLYQKQRPYISKNTKVLTQFEWEYFLFNLWDKDERKKRFELITYKE